MRSMVEGAATGTESSLAPSTALRLSPSPVAARQGRIPDCKLRD